MAINGHFTDIKKSIDQLDSKLDQALDNLSAKVEILSYSINSLTGGLKDFKDLFKSAVPIRLVVILLAMEAALFGLAETIKMIFKIP